jgi:hypothetical protein
MDHWILLEKLRVDFHPSSRSYVLTNDGMSRLSGVSVVIPSGASVSGRPFNHRELGGGNQIIWFDLDPNQSATIHPANK